MSTDWNSDTMGEFAFSLKLGFDADDLLANRARQLSPRQRRKLIRGVIGFPIFLIVFDVVLWKVFEIVPPRGGVPNIYIHLSLLFVTNVYLLWYWLKTSVRDFFDLHVHVVEGRARHFTKEVFKGRRSEPRDYIAVARLQFRMSSSYAQHAFAEGQTYRVYYLPYSQTILSAEPIQTIPADTESLNNRPSPPAKMD
jgi:hypothetical protein